ncbi:MAG: hypothetical protein MUO72_15820 [Bacteroidales bacterium]|nr:hypothetical protein [Bacteroidales bacterium]
MDAIIKTDQETIAFELANVIASFKIAKVAELLFILKSINHENYFLCFVQFFVI